VLARLLITFLLSVSWARAQPANSPPGTESLQVQWIEIAVPDQGTMFAAVAKPSGAGPFPAVLVVGKLLAAVRSLPDVRRDRIGIFGHSRGGGAALNYVLGASDVQAAALNSAGYPASLAVSRLRVPLLILHGTADDPADGGSAFTDIQMARNFAAAIRGAGKTVQTHYYEGGRHNGMFANSEQFGDERKRLATFFTRSLSD
jgi:dienelactone hydrolase